MKIIILFCIFMLILFFSVKYYSSTHQTENIIPINEYDGVNNEEKTNKFLMANLPLEFKKIPNINDCTLIIDSTTKKVTLNLEVKPKSNLNENQIKGFFEILNNSINKKYNNINLNINEIESYTYNRSNNSLQRRN